MKNILVVLLVVSAGACSSGKRANDTAFMTSAAVPAAQGNVLTRQDVNGNTELSVNVRHLAPPQRLAAGAQTYVVWIQPSGQMNYQNIGALQVNENLEGNYRTKVPYKNFNLMVTPENTNTVPAPTNQAVLQKSVNI